MPRMADTPGPEQSPKAPNGTPKPRGDWKSLHLWQIQGIRDVLVVLGVLGLLWLGQKISIVTVPLLLAILFAYLFEPVIRWLMKRSGMKRQGAVTAVLAATILAVVVPSALGLTFGIIQSAGLVKDLATNTGITLSAVTEGAKLRDARAELERIDPPTVEPDAASDANTDGEPTTPTTDGPGDTTPAQTEAQAAEIEALQDKINTLEAEYQSRLDKTTAAAGPAYRWIADFLNKNDDGENLTNALASAQNWLTLNADGVATAGAGAIRTTINFFGSVFSLLFMVFITAFFFFFLATGWVEVQAFGAKLVPDKHRDLLFDLLTKFDAVISSFIRGRLTIAFIQAIVFTVGYLIIGVPAAFILGPVVAILSIVPYLALVGLPISAVLLALEGQGNSGFRGEWWWYLGAPTFIYFLGQALDDYVWTPLIQGKGTDMSTPMILFASLAGGALFGVFGLLIAIPIAACLKILIQEVFWPRFKAWAEGREQDFLPIDRA